MKIYGTAKGGALSKKDFGVAFSAGGAVIPTVCYNQAYLNEIYEYVLDPPTSENFVIGAYIDGTSNPIYDQAITLISIFAYAEATVEGGSFALGVWDSSGNLKNESSAFGSSAFPAGSLPAIPSEKLTKSIPETTIAVGDSIGIICKTPITAGGQISNGGWQKGSTITNWSRSVFVQGNTPVVATTRTLPICVNE